MRYQDLKANLTKRYNAAVRLYETIATDHEAVLDQLRGGCSNARHQLQEYVDALQCETVHLHNAHAARAAAIPELDEGLRLREEQQFPEIREKVYELLSKITDATVTLQSNLKATKVEEEKPPQQGGSVDGDRLVSPLAQDDSKMDDQEAEDPATRAPVTDNQHNYSNLNVSYVPEDAGPGPASAGSHQNSNYMPEDAGPGSAPAGGHQNFSYVPEDAAPGPAPAGMQQNVAYHQMQARFDSRNPFTIPDEDFAQILMTTPQTVPTRRIAETTTQMTLPRTFPYLPPAGSARRTEQTPRSQDARWTTTPRTPGRVEWADDYEDFKTPMTHIPVRTTAMRPFTLDENVPRQPMQAATRVHGTYPARSGFLPLPYTPHAVNHVSTGTLVDIGREPVSFPRNGHVGLQAVTQGMQRLTTTELPYTVPVGRYVNQHVVYGPTYVREPAEPVIEHVGTREQTYALPRRTHAEPAAHPVFRNEGRHFRPQIDPPKIRLPTFHGRRGEDWNKFSSLFKAVIHNRIDISDEEKLWYLIGCLQDEASNVISGLSYTAECYPIAMELLEERYGDRDEAKVKLIEELRRLRNGCRTDGYGYYDKLMSIVNQLRALGTNTEEEPLRVLIDDTVPQWIRTYIDQERLREPAWTTAKLLTTIRRVVHLFNNRHDHGDFPITTIPASNSAHRRHSQQPQRRHDSSPTVFEETKSPTRTNIRQTNRLEQTPDVNAQEGWQPRRCFNCGRPGHLAAQCRTRPNNSTSNVVYEQIEEIPTVQLTSTDKCDKGETPLPIAQGHVLNPTTGRRVKTLILLDTGSQKDYVTEALVSALKLPKTDEETLTINGFLGMKTSTKAATTEILIEGQDGCRTKVSASCIKRPVNPMQIKRVAEDGRTLVSQLGIPSVILGNKTAWKFIKGKSAACVDGYKCLESTLGLLLTGERVEEEATTCISIAQCTEQCIGGRNSLKPMNREDIDPPRKRKKRRPPPVRRRRRLPREQQGEQGAFNEAVGRPRNRDAGKRIRREELNCVEAGLYREGGTEPFVRRGRGRRRGFHSGWKEVVLNYSSELDPEEKVPLMSGRRKVAVRGHR